MPDGALCVSRPRVRCLPSYALSALPMFILMGSMAFASGIGKKAFDSVYVVMGQLRGGLVIATAVASAIFGSVCGSGPATAVAIGKTVIPEMERRNCNPVLALGAVASSGTLGFMIPPSAMFIIYGYLTEQSVGKLFISGILPGTLVMSLSCLTAVIVCWIKPEWGPAGAATTIKHDLHADRRGYSLRPLHHGIWVVTCLGRFRGDDLDQGRSSAPTVDRRNASARMSGPRRFCTIGGWVRGTTAPEHRGRIAGQSGAGGIPRGRCPRGHSAPPIW